MFSWKAAVDYAWKSFKERGGAAMREAATGCIDDLATALKEAIAPKPEG